MADYGTKRWRDASGNETKPNYGAASAAMRKLGNLFKPGAGARPLSEALNPAATSPAAPMPTGLADQISNEFAAPAATSPAAPKPVVAPEQMSVPGADATMPARDPNAPVADQRLTALGVRGDWKPMTRAAGNPIKDATIYSNPAGNSFAGYGTQDPAKQAADTAAADAAHRKTMDMYASESQARLGARIAQARLQGEDGYADSLEKQQTQQNAASLTGAQAKAALAGSEGLGALRTAQAGEATAQAEQAKLGVGQQQQQNAYKNEYLDPKTSPERRVALSALLGLKDSEYDFMPVKDVGPDGMTPIQKVVRVNRRTGAFEDASGGGNTSKDSEALAWAKSNPKDPRSAQILARLKG